MGQFSMYFFRYDYSRVRISSEYTTEIYYNCQSFRGCIWKTRTNTNPDNPYWFFCQLLDTTAIITECDFRQANIQLRRKSEIIKREQTIQEPNVCSQSVSHAQSRIVRYNNLVRIPYTRFPKYIYNSPISHTRNIHIYIHYTNHIIWSDISVLLE
jgi:hypothetical protein